LALKLKNPARVLETLPSAKTLEVGGTEVVVTRHTLKAVKRLRELGIRAPSPILHYYDWPGQFTPYEHQRLTASFLTVYDKCLVLNEIGTGKTQSALWAADYLMSIGAVKKVLVLSPLSTLERVWGDAIFKQFFHRKHVVLHGSAARRKKLLNSEADFYIINHDGFSIIADEAVGMFDLVIVDEAAVLRNPSTSRYKHFKKWMGKNPDTRLWLMTGTPTPNDPTDAWALSQLVDSPYATRTYTAFREQVMMKVGQWKFVPRPESVDIVKNILQPAIRYTRDECFDLPDTVIQTRKVELTADQKKHYTTMLKRLVIEMQQGGTTISAVNEAVKVQKLVQIACIAKGTPVLCARGWVPIEHVTPDDLVWDGCEWVSQGGAIYRGVKPTVTLAGVRLTRDHKVLTASGWVQAGDILGAESRGRFTRQEVWLPDSYPAGRYFKEQVRALGMYLRLRLSGSTHQSVLTESAAYEPTELWLRTWQSNTRNDEVAALPYMDAYEAQVFRPQLQRLPQLGRARNHSMPAMVRQLRGILGGYAGGLLGCAFVGPDRQQRALRARELSVGDAKAAGAEPTQEVYDLIDCGPRNRFVVRGSGGELTIVHNCGVAYTDDGQDFEIDCSPRVNAVKEVIEEAGEKVIVFVPLTGTLNMLERELSKRWSVGVVNGAVSSKKRDQIFYDFQHSKDPRVLIAHPATMAHGLTLTAASTVIWYGPITSNEQYVQANGRVERIGKKHVSNVVHIEATDLEYKMYHRLANKQKLQGLLLDLIQQATE
jgi:superfamily II DNA or RNA helicase